MKDYKYSLLSVLGALVITSCSSASFMVANLPVHFSGMRQNKDIAYGSEKWQKLDIYSPQNGNRTSSVIVFLYGGRWTFGHKEQYAFVALPFVKRGYTVVIPDYSKYPDVKFPTFVEDVALAVSWTHDHINSYGGNAERLYLAGHSSGAHLAALIITDSHYLSHLNKERTIIKGFAGLAGPYDFVPEEKDLKDMFGPPENYKNMQVSTFIDGKQPPMLLLQGENDKEVAQANMKKLQNKIEQKGGIVQTKIYPGINHKKIVGALSWVWRDKACVDKDIISFFERIK